MDYELPDVKGFTVYSKSGCPNCLKTKALLKDKKFEFNIVDCDEYIIENKEGFLLFIKEISQKEVNQFPIIFYEGIYLGGYKETKEYIDKLLSFVENFTF